MISIGVLLRSDTGVRWEISSIFSTNPPLFQILNYFCTGLLWFETCISSGSLSQPSVLSDCNNLLQILILEIVLRRSGHHSYRPSLHQNQTPSVPNDAFESQLPGLILGQLLFSLSKSEYLSSSGFTIIVLQAHKSSGLVLAMITSSSFRLEFHMDKFGWKLLVDYLSISYGCSSHPVVVVGSGC